MSIMLIHPNLMEDNKRPPIGIGYIAASLKTNKISYELLDLNAESLSLPNLMDKIRHNKSKIFGLSVYSWTFRYARIVCQLIKSEIPDSIIILGGPYATGDPGLVMKIIPEADIIVCGEGEKAICTVYDEINKANANLGSVNGIAFRIGDEIVLTGGSNIINELDDVKSPYLSDIFDLSKYTRASIALSRGCPHNCGYCSWGSPKDMGLYRRYSLDMVMDEIKVLNYYDINRFILNDGTTNAGNQLASFCGKLLKSNLSYYFHDIDMRVENVTDELIYLLKAINTTEVGFGFETANPKTQKLIKKDLDIEKLPMVVKKAKEAGLLIHVSFIIGLPFETDTDVLRTIDFAKKIPADEFGIFALRLQPGTEFYEKSEEYGIRILEFDYNNCEFKIETSTLPYERNLELTSYAKSLFKYIGHEHKINAHRVRVLQALL